MKLKSLKLAVAWFLIACSTSLAAQTGCPEKNPNKRPADAGATQSSWDLAKILQYMVNPDPSLVLVTSHRGNWEYCPENTLEAFQSAWDEGAEAAEMDVRLTKPNVSDDGVEYPDGEVFLSHDFDVRGEAPAQDPNVSNLIYDLSPDELRSRTMVDRHGEILKDSAGNYLRPPSFTELLNSLYERAQKTGKFHKGIGGGVNSWDLLNNGMLLVVDVKSLPSAINSNPASTQQGTFLECVRELYAFQVKNRVDLQNAIAFKVGFAEFSSMKVTPADVLAYTRADDLIKKIKALPKYQENQGLPNLIFIIFAQDLFRPPPDPNGQDRIPFFCRGPVATTGCKFISPELHAPLNDYRENYKLEIKGREKSYFLVNDWQYWNPGNAVEEYLKTPIWKTRGNAMFMASNNFAEGVRNSLGNCSNTFNPPEGVTDHNPNDHINTSYCTSDPVRRWSSASIDYLIPGRNTSLIPAGLDKRATSITTDQYQNAILYLTKFNLNNTNLIK